jgi:hypothetical protein
VDESFKFSVDQNDITKSVPSITKLLEKRTLLTKVVPKAPPPPPVTKQLGLPGSGVLKHRVADLDAASPSNMLAQGAKLLLSICPGSVVHLSLSGSQLIPLTIWTDGKPAWTEILKDWAWNTGKTSEVWQEILMLGFREIPSNEKSREALVLRYSLGIHDSSELLILRLGAASKPHGVVVCVSESSVIKSLPEAISKFSNYNPRTA